MSSIYLTEFRGQLFTPEGTVDDWVLARDAQVGRRPRVEGPYDYDTRVVSTGKDKVTFYDFTPWTRATPDDARQPFEKAGFIVQGDVKSTWPVGLTALVGKGGTGKTRIRKRIARAINADIFTVGEPEPGSRPFTPSVYNDIVNDMLMVKPRNGYLNSMRLASLGGSALGAGGISRDIAFQLSQIDYVARINGLIVFGAINLLTEDDRAGESAYAVISGSVTAVVLLEKSSVAGGVTTLGGSYSARPNERGLTPFNIKLEPGE
jgi:hypothetical protein